MSESGQLSYKNLRVCISFRWRLKSPLFLSFRSCADASGNLSNISQINIHYVVDAPNDGNNARVPK
jgi:hypothetical protein